LPTVRELRPDLPDDLCEIAGKLLAPDRALRYADARDAQVALVHTDSAPRHGAVLLAQILRDRFPDEAPRRAQRGDPPARALTPAPGIAVTGVEPTLTAAASGAVPKAQQHVLTRTAAPSVEIVMSSSTDPGTLAPVASDVSGSAAPRPTRVWRSLALAVAVVAIVGVVLAVQRERRSSRPIAGGDAPVDAPILAGEVDAGMIDASAAAPVIDAPLAAPDAGAAARPRGGTRARTYTVPDASVPAPRPSIDAGRPPSDDDAVMEPTRRP
jgi:hypothetical protein